MIGIYAEASRYLPLFDQATLTRTLHSAFSNDPAQPISSVLEKASGWKWIKSIAAITVDSNNNNLKSCIYDQGTASEKELRARLVRVMDPTHSLPQAVIDEVEKSSTNEIRVTWTHALREFAANNLGTPIFLISPKTNR